MQILDQQHWDQAPSVIAYDVEGEIGRSRQTVRALGGELSAGRPTKGADVRLTAPIRSYKGARAEL
jgi:hypothetical protein